LVQAALKSSIISKNEPIKTQAERGTSMYLQGNLQAVFDALYHMGIIDPVLEKDWAKELDQMSMHAESFFEVLTVANRHQGDVGELMTKLKNFDEQTLTYLAMEVAREYADYHSREALH
jgi:hypothetical protein